jgi:hypothetical protein
MRRTPDGDFALIVDGKSHPDIQGMLESGVVDLTGLIPDPNRYRLALLKHAYLAACLKFGKLVGAPADQIRHDLIAARDAAGRKNVPYSALAMGLTVLRVHSSTPPVPSALVHAVVLAEEEPMHGVILAGRVFVSWFATPPAEPPLVSPRQLSARLHVGPVISGVVRDVD